MSHGWSNAKYCRKLFGFEANNFGYTAERLFVFAVHKTVTPHAGAMRSIMFTSDASALTPRVYNFMVDYEVFLTVCLFLFPVGCLFF